MLGIVWIHQNESRNNLKKSRICLLITHNWFESDCIQVWRKRGMLTIFPGPQTPKKSTVFDLTIIPFENILPLGFWDLGNFLYRKVQKTNYPPFLLEKSSKVKILSSNEGGYSKNRPEERRGRFLGCTGGSIQYFDKPDLAFPLICPRAL